MCDGDLELYIVQLLLLLDLIVCFPPPLCYCDTEPELLLINCLKLQFLHRFLLFRERILHCLFVCILYKWIWWPVNASFVSQCKVRSFVRSFSTIIFMILSMMSFVSISTSNFHFQLTRCYISDLQNHYKQQYSEYHSMDQFAMEC